MHSTTSEVVKLKVDKYTAPALEKGLDILDLLTTVSTGLTQIEIAQHLNRTVSEIFRMLVVLRRREMIALDEQTDRYYLTTKIFEMAQKIPVIKRLRIVADPIMNVVAERCNQSVHLAVLSGNSIVIIAVVENPDNHVFLVRLGARIDLWTTASGPVILAFQNNFMIDRFLKLYPHPQHSKARVCAKLEQIREQKILLRPSHVISGVTNMSSPVVGHDGYSVAALTIPYIEMYSSTNMSKEGCRNELMAAVTQLSCNMGGNQVTFDNKTKESVLPIW